MNILEEARIILQHQTKDQVDGFLTGCDGRIPQEVSGAFEYFRAGSETIQLINGDIKALERLKKHNPTALPAPLVDGRIHELKLLLAINDVLKTGGKPTSLTHVDLMNLHILHEIFRMFFPALSSEFGRENLLFQLGEVLVRKPIPDSIEVMMGKDQAISITRNRSPPKSPRTDRFSPLRVNAR